jgi:hypothetical protein
MESITSTSGQPQEDKKYVKMTVAVMGDADGNIRVRLGNCKHCVTRRQRPPLSPTSGQPHPGDLEKDDLIALNDRLNTIVEQRFGIKPSEVTFVEKTTMPRAITPDA